MRFLGGAVLCATPSCPEAGEGHHLGELEPRSDFDVRRFRMNVIVDTHARGFVENDWVGRTLAIGDYVRLSVALPDPRCVMPSVAQEDLPKDPKILKALAQHNRIDVAGGALPLCRRLRSRGSDRHDPPGRPRQPGLSSPTSARPDGWPARRNTIRRVWESMPT
jgi:MOSC domain